MSSNDELIPVWRRELPRGEVWPTGQRAWAAPSPNSVLTWEQAVRVLRKHFWFLVLLAGGLTLATVAAALLMRNVYQPIARVQIDPAGAGIKTLQEIENPTALNDLDYLDTQAQILQGDGLAMRVIRTLQLDHNPEFVNKSDLAATQPASADSNTQGPRPEDGVAFLKEQLDLADPTPTEAAALRKFHTNLSVNPVRGSRLIEVAFSSHDPKTSQNVTNTLVAQFIDQDYRNRYITTMGASEWLSTQINDLRQKVSESNRAVAEYQKRYGLVDASSQQDVPIGQLMGDVSRQLSDAQADRIQYEAYMRMIDMGQQDSIPLVRDDLVYQNLLTHYAEVRAEVARAQTIYGDENSNVKKLQNQAMELLAQIEAERTRLVSRVRTGFAAARAREDLMKQSRDKLRAEMGDESSHLVEYQTLKNEAAANAQLYNTLQTRLREAGIYAGLRSGDIRVVDMAPFLHRATSPHRTLIIALGTTLSVVFSLVLVFVRESLDNTVHTPDDIRDWLNLPSLAVLPRVSANTADSTWKASRGDESLRVTTGTPQKGAYPKLFWYRVQSAEAEAIRELRTALLIAGPGRGPSPKVVLVSSAIAGEGKTTVAINLAGVLAQQGNTCLMEGDFRRPMIASAMGLRAKTGLAEVLNGKATLADALLTATGVPGLSVLPAKTLPDNAADLLASEAMAQTLRTLRETFQFVVIDSPPVIPFSDARSLAPLADAAILVSRYGATTRRTLTRGVEILHDMQAPLLGVVLNDMDLTSADYHYFNYGYSWRTAGNRSRYGQKYLPPPSNGNDSGPEQSRGAHA